jgi:hypothetical protein
VPGKSLAGVDLGDLISSIQAKLGVPTHPIIANMDKGEVHSYSIAYKVNRIFLYISTDRNSKEVYYLSLRDDDFNENNTFPSYNGVTIGTHRGVVLRNFGKPNRIGSSSNGGGDIKCSSDDYYYDGINLSICSHNDLVHSFTIN